jgi:hypothetical protein
VFHVCVERERQRLENTFEIYLNKKLNLPKIILKRLRFLERERERERMRENGVVGGGGPMVVVVVTI